METGLQLAKSDVGLEYARLKAAAIKVLAGEEVYSRPWRLLQELMVLYQCRKAKDANEPCKMLATALSAERYMLEDSEIVEVYQYLCEELDQRHRQRYAESQRERQFTKKEESGSDPEANKAAMQVLQVMAEAQIRASALEVTRSKKGVLQAIGNVNGQAFQIPLKTGWEGRVQALAA